MVFWDCTAPIILVMRPPTAQNFAIGIQSPKIVNDKRAQHIRKKVFTDIVNASLSNMKFKDSPINEIG